MVQAKPSVKLMEKTGFNKVLGKWDIFTLAFGAMIGWGWVLLTGDWILKAGMPGAIMAFITGGFVVVLVGLTFAELTAAMPAVGGEFVFTYRGMGLDASFICTWFIIFGYVSICAFEAVALPVVLENLVTINHGNPLWFVKGEPIYLSWVIIGVMGALFVGTANIAGMKSATFFQIVFTLVLLITGCMLFFGSIFSAQTPIESVDTRNILKISPGMVSVLIMTPFMLVGFDVIPQSAEEIALPYKQIGRVLVFSVLLAILWYTVIIFSVGITLGSNELKQNTLAPAIAMQKIYGGAWAKNFLIIGGLAGIVTSWNSFLIGSTRAIYAMANSNMLPRAFAYLHPKYKSPVVAIVFVTITSIIATLFGKATIEWLVNAGGFGIVISWNLVAFSFYRLRIKEPLMTRPYKVAHGKIVGATAFLLSLLLLYLYVPGNTSALNMVEWSIVGSWIVIGLVLYTWAGMVYGRKSMRNKIDRHLSR